METMEMLAKAMDKIIDEKVAEKQIEFDFQKVQDWVMSNSENYTKILDFCADEVRFDDYVRSKNYVNIDEIDEDRIFELVYDNNMEKSIAETYMDNMDCCEKSEKVKEWINDLL